MVAKARSARQEQTQRALELRSRHEPWTAIATEFAERYGVNVRVAFRLAHGWSQGNAAEQWNRRRPAEPKTFKSFSYWELWPASTGHAPSLDVLARLAELYECRVADLLIDCPDFRQNDAAHQSRTGLAALPTERPAPPDDGSASEPKTANGRLSGIWLSRYRYHSDGRDQDVENQHYLVLHHDPKLVTAQSLPNSLYSLVRAGAHGALQLVADPTARSMTGKWVGFDMRHQVNHGPWLLNRVATSTARSTAREFHFKV